MAPNHQRDAWELVSQICSDLCQVPKRSAQPLSSAPGSCLEDPLGSSFQALLLAHFSRHFPGSSGLRNQAALQAHKLLENADTCKVWVHGHFAPGLFSGWPGTQWVRWETEKVLGISGAPSKIRCRSFQEENWLLQILSRNYCSGRADLITGIAGLGLYGVKGWSHTGQGIYRKICGEAVAQLEAHSLKQRNGRIWTSLGPQKKPRKSGRHVRVDLGLAHGLAGIMIFLASCYTHGIEKRLTRKMLNETTQWLMDQKTFGGTFLFPAVLDDGIAVPCPRLSWCYGDMGIAVALRLVGEATGDKSLTEESLSLISRALHIPRSETQVQDPGICHGSSGVALISSLFSQQRSKPVFVKAAQYWLRETVTLAQNTPVKETGLLKGSTGIALSLMHNMLPANGNWVSFLGLTLPV